MTRDDVWTFCAALVLGLAGTAAAALTCDDVGNSPTLEAYGVVEDGKPLAVPATALNGGLYMKADSPDPATTITFHHLVVRTDERALVRLRRVP
jgi:hypothetical protein